MRSLSAEEKELWDRVAATIRPLSREPADSLSSAKQSNPRPKVPRAAAGPAPPQGARPRSSSPGGTLDSTWDRRLRGGKLEPDRVLDLHGLTLDQAWTAIDRALERAVASDERVLLLITGHARPGEPPVQRGKIRAAVHDWLAASRHAGAIIAVRGAHRRHGGGGSLYIILRRSWAKSTVS